MIDPILSLALNLNSYKGAYALLLGSGVSRGAEIPTGWEVVLDLIKKLSKLSKDDCGESPEDWYTKKFKSEPNYSKILEEVAPTKTERNKLLQVYFEPSEEEKEEGKKLPTKAHKAIAELVSRGYIKVIITTNFDRLIEKALEEKGIIPTVIHNEDSAKGALPLTHAKCVVVKIHGDYLDSRIKNTPEELSGYGDEMNALLDRVFDEYGLITCGWSGEWDSALRDAISRCKGRRFTYYFTRKGDLSSLLEDIIKDKSGKTIEIKNADDFFEDINEKLLSLEDVEVSHPVSAKLAVSTVKRYLSDRDKYRIKLYDLITKESLDVHERIASDEFTAEGQQLVNEDFLRRISKYESIIRILQSTLVTTVYWGDEGHVDLIKSTVERVADVEQGSGLTVYNNLKLYPALLLLYGIGISAIASKNYPILKALLIDATHTNNYGRQNLIFPVKPYEVISVDNANKILIGDGQKYHTPMSDYLRKLLKSELKDFINGDKEFDRAFDVFEYLLCLAHADLREKAVRDDGFREWWGPIGRFGWKMKSTHKADNPIDDFCKMIEADGNNSSVLKSGLFDGSIERFKEVKEGVDKYINGLSWF